MAKVHKVQLQTLHSSSTAEVLTRANSILARGPALKAMLQHRDQWLNQVLRLVLEEIWLLQQEVGGLRLELVDSKESPHYWKVGLVLIRPLSFVDYASQNWE